MRARPSEDCGRSSALQQLQQSAQSTDGSWKRGPHALYAGQCCNSCNNQLSQQTQLEDRPPALYAGLSQLLQRSLLQHSVAAVAAVISRVNSGKCK